MSSTARGRVRPFSNVALLLALAWTTFPVYWMLMTALRPSSEVFQRPLQFWPETFTTDNFGRVLSGLNPVPRFLLNSLVTSLASTILVLVVAVPAAYAFSRLRFPFRRGFFFTIMMAQMIPLVVMLLPLYIIFFQTGLLNTYHGLVFAFASLSLPFAIWILKTFIDSVPKELDDAARVDGCSRIQTLRLVVLPILGPGIVAAGSLAFLDAWNNLLVPLALTTSLDMKTLPAGILLTFQGEFRTDWGGMMATALVVALPVVLLFIACQRFLVRGLTQGSVKG
jgi:multiple sugar transport system permease protein